MTGEAVKCSSHYATSPSLENEADSSDSEVFVSGDTVAARSVKTREKEQMTHKIIQWNCRGLRSNYNDLAILLQEHSPSAVCLLETNLKPNTNIRFENYSIVNCFGPANNERACCGASIFVKDGTPHQHIALNTNLQVAAVNMNCHRPMMICSVYLGKIQLSSSLSMILTQ